MGWSVMQSEAEKVVGVIVKGAAEVERDRWIEAIKAESAICAEVSKSLQTIAAQIRNGNCTQCRGSGLNPSTRGKLVQCWICGGSGGLEDARDVSAELDAEFEDDKGDATTGTIH